MPLGERHVVVTMTAMTLDQPSAANARAVISSTDPVPLILRHLGACESPLADQFE